MRKVKGKTVTLKVQISKFKFQRRKHSLTEFTEKQIKQKTKRHRDLTVIDITETLPHTVPPSAYLSPFGEGQGGTSVLSMTVRPLCVMLAKKEFCEFCEKTRLIHNSEL